MNTLEVMTPATLPELTAALAEMTPESRILAGGTDLIIALRRGEATADRLLDISGVDELRAIRRHEDHIVVGANATFSDLMQSDAIRCNAACLAQAAGMIGSVQIRNRATIAGNIATASPAGDAITPLVALDAEVSIVDAAGNVRRQPIADLFTGPYATDLTHDEAIIDFRIPVSDADTVSAFVKLGSRSTVTIARLNLAVALDLASDGKGVTDARVALGAVGRTVFRSAAAEECLVDSGIHPPAADRFAAVLVEAVEASIPGRYSLPYKRRAVEGLARDALDKLLSAGFDSVG